MTTSAFAASDILPPIAASSIQTLSVVQSNPTQIKIKNTHHKSIWLGQTILHFVDATAISSVTLDGHAATLQQRTQTSKGMEYTFRLPQTTSVTLKPDQTATLKLEMQTTKNPTAPFNITLTEEDSVPVVRSVGITSGFTNSGSVLITVCNNQPDGADILLKTKLVLSFDYAGQMMSDINGNPSVWGDPYLDWVVTSTSATPTHYEVISDHYAYPSTNIFAYTYPDCDNPITLNFTPTDSSSKALPTNLVFKSSNDPISGSNPPPQGQSEIDVSVGKSPAVGVSAPHLTLTSQDKTLQQSHDSQWEESWSVDNLSAGTYTATATPVTDGQSFYAAASQSVKVDGQENVNRLNLNYDTTPLPTGEVDLTLTGNPDSSEYLTFTDSHGIRYRESAASGQSLKLPYETYSIGGSKLGYQVNTTPSTITLKDENPVAVTVNFSADPVQPLSGTIPGWPSYLAMGTVTDNSTAVQNQLSSRPVDAIFKYAGIGGDGDPGKITDEVVSNPTTEQRTVEQARALESATGHAVMPVLVIYTINLSGGMPSGDDIKNGVNNDLTDDATLKDHYINLINYSKNMEAYKDTQHPHPATFILNPDFMGAMEQNKNSVDWDPNALQPSTPVHVKEVLQQAFDYTCAKAEQDPSAPAGFVSACQKGSFAIPSDLTEDLRGYIKSVNWVVRNVAPDVPFGWQENIWSTGSAYWLHQILSSDQINTQQSQPVLDYITNQLDAYKNDSYKPDFLVFDRYERDDFFTIGNTPVEDTSKLDTKTGWFYNRNDWVNYLTFVDQVSRQLKMPAMLWQIPGGHMLTQNDHSSLEIEHVATAPDFFFGDASISGSDFASLIPNVLNYYVTTTGLDTLRVQDYLQRDTDQDWRSPALGYAVNHNIAAILWGGGSTTAVGSISTNGDDGGWLANEVQDYYKNPVVLPVEAH